MLDQPVSERPSIHDLPLQARVGAGLRRAAWAVCALLIVQSLNLSRMFDDGTGLGQLMALPWVILAAVTVAVGLHSWRARIEEGALRRRAANALEVLAADPRQPVLYLRPFDEDLAQAQSGRWLRWIPAPYLGLSAEQQISRLMAGVGPLVAIGRPGEALPPLGFARLYVADDAWQGAVLDLLSRSAAVVLVAGKSPGLLWELECVIRHAAPERIMIIVPAWPSYDHARFRAEVQRRLGIELPAITPGLRGPFPNDIRALIGFDQAGRPRLFEWDWNDIPAAERGVIKRSMFRWLGGRGIPLFGALDARADQLFDRAIGPILRPHGIAAPDPKAALAISNSIEQQKRIVRWVALAVFATIVAVMAFGLLAHA